MKILFIQTGGTIDKDYPKKVKGYNFEIGNAAALTILSKVAPNFDYKSVSLFKKDSLDIEEKDRKKLYDFCEKTSFSKIIITHGTDTMVQTSQALSKIKNKIIVLTGSIRPEKFVDSDADFNIGTAVGAINVLKPGVYIAMNGRIYPWNKCHKDQKTGQFVEN